MSADPSLSSFLTQQDASSSALPSGDTNEAALLNYFQAPYHGEAIEQLEYHSPAGHAGGHDGTDLAIANAYGPGAGGRGGSLIFDYAPELAYRPRSPSPIDPSIVIPDSLSNLAYSISLPAPPSMRPAPSALPKDLPDHGEMGGKRRKNPSDRAGWKEMDEQGGPSLKRKKKKQDSPWQAGGMDQEVEAQAALAEFGGPVDVKNADGPELVEAEESSKAAEKIVGRAEQNRRAQQAFRRRREQRMVQLEADAEALKPTRDILISTQADLAAVSLNYEAALLEIAALRGALTTLAARSETSALDESGGLLVSEQGKSRKATSRDASDLQDAIKLLVGQSRVLAKQRRANAETESRLEL